jgi:hypothetical protein
MDRTSARVRRTTQPGSHRAGQAQKARRRVGYNEDSDMNHRCAVSPAAL